MSVLTRRVEPLLEGSPAGFRYPQSRAGSVKVAILPSTTKAGPMGIRANVPARPADPARLHLFAEGATMIIRLGNPQAISLVEEEDDQGYPVRTRNSIEGSQVTTIKPPADISAWELMTTLVHPNGIWNAHSDADKPAWVSCDDEEYGQMLAKMWGVDYLPFEPENGEGTSNED